MRTSPASQLVTHLRDLRARGVPFNAAWDAALPQIEWSPMPTEEKMDRQAIDWARDAFRDAYEHPQTTPRWVLTILAEPDEETTLAA